MDYIISSICLLAVLVAGIYVLRLRKNYRSNLEYIKTVDLETGIGNLYYFEQFFFKRIPDEKREQHHIAYIKIDSNYLQIYHGEVVSKDAIMFTAQVLNQMTQTNGFAARISENGFAYIFESDSAEETEKTINSIVYKLNTYINTIRYNKGRFFCIAVYRLQFNERNVDLLLYNLRQKCNEITNTPTQVYYFDTSITKTIAEEKQLNDSIVKGLSNNEFKLYLQFIVDNQTKRIVSAEALSRWESSDFGFLTPNKYLPTMEKFGYISRLDYYMFEACCRQLHKWDGTEFGDLTLSCNFTRTTLSEKDFMEKITEIAQRYVFEKRKLLLEITEEAIEKSIQMATKNVAECKKLGFRIALDDMGTGYTSLKNLCDYPIDVVKIDREILLKSATENGNGLFSGIISLAHSLGMKVICEGVETDEQKAFVDETSCDYVQGWYYSKVFPVRNGEQFAKDQL